MRKEKLITAPKGPDGSRCPSPVLCVHCGLTSDALSSSARPASPCLSRVPRPVLHPRPSRIPARPASLPVLRPPARPASLHVLHPCLSCVPRPVLHPYLSCIPACPASPRPSRIPARPASPPVLRPRPSRIPACPASLPVLRPPARPASPPVPSPPGCCPEPLRPGTSVLHLAVAPGSFHTWNNHTDLVGGAGCGLVTASRGF